jgi:predicted transcriptional regulator of viral defense system
VSARNWVREAPGIYRLALFPRPERPDLLMWRLWSRDRSGGPQGVYSHRTALSLHDLTDLMPAKIDMTVPRPFRRGTPIPRIPRLRYNDLHQDEIEKIYGVPVTNALRTILDMWQSEEISRDILRAALKEGIRLGKIRSKQIQAASKSRKWRKLMAEITEGSAA